MNFEMQTEPSPSTSVQLDAPNNWNLTTICIEAIHFLKIWYWPIAEFILSLVPGTICLIMSVLYLKQQSNITIIRIEKKLRNSRINLVFGSVGIFLVIAISLSVFIINGYQN
ncbi:hypothetical protein WR25_00327 [Diploscapter pachys]|uniref:Uncharacterized protein n=1 Tax=Diploscapter pachys TaxID=2018661 RepID=A0A2A2LK27_9BILA|nr:hypothetical protein WR25_00327 [Diploscapter pachys]